MHASPWQSERVIAHEFMLHSSAHGHISLALLCLFFSSFGASLYFLLSIFTPPSVQHHASVMPPLVIAFLPTHRAPKLRFSVVTASSLRCTFVLFHFHRQCPADIRLTPPYFFSACTNNARPSCPFFLLLSFTNTHTICPQLCHFVVPVGFFNICCFVSRPLPLFFPSLFAVVFCCARWSSCLLPPRPINRSLNHVAVVAVDRQQVAEAHVLRLILFCHSSRLSFCCALLALSAGATKPQCILAVETLHTIACLSAPF